MTSQVVSADNDVAMSNSELKQGELTAFFRKALPPDNLLNDPESSHEALVYACITVPEDVKPLIKAKTGIRIRGDVQGLTGRGIFRLNLGMASFADCFGGFRGDSTFDVVPSYRSTPLRFTRFMNRFLIRNIPSLIFTKLEEYVQAVRDENDELAGKLAADFLSSDENKIRIGKKRINAVSHIRPLAAKRDLYVNVIITPFKGNEEAFTMLDSMSVRTGNVTASLEVVPFYDYRDVPVTIDLACENASQLRQLQLTAANKYVLEALQTVFSVSELELPSWKLYLYGQDELEAEPASPQESSADVDNTVITRGLRFNAGGRPRTNTQGLPANYCRKNGPCFKEVRVYHRSFYACRVKADGNCFIYALQSLGAVRGTVEQCRQDLRMAAQHHSLYLQQLVGLFGECFEQVKKFEGTFSNAGIVFAASVFRHRLIVVNIRGEVVLDSGVVANQFESIPFAQLETSWKIFHLLLHAVKSNFPNHISPLFEQFPTDFVDDERDSGPPPLKRARKHYKQRRLDDWLEGDVEPAVNDPEVPLDEQVGNATGWTHLKIFQWNIFTATEPKLQNLLSSLQDQNILCLSETRGEHTLAGFQGFHSVEKRGVGVSLFVKNGILCERFPLLEVELGEYGAETVAVKIAQETHAGIQEIVVVSFYIRPNADQHKVAALLQRLDRMDNVIITGDFNCPGNMFYNTSGNKQPAGTAFDAFMRSANRLYLARPREEIETFTFHRGDYSAYLDGALVSSSIPYEDWAVLPPIPTSDHLPTELSCPIKILSWNPPEILRFRRLNSKALIKHLLDLKPTPDPQDFCSKLQQALKHASKCTPNSRHDAKPWWNDQCKIAIKKRNRLRNSLRTFQGSHADWIAKKQELNEFYEDAAKTINVAKREWKRQLAIDASTARNPWKCLAPIIGTRFSRKCGLSSQRQQWEARRKAEELAKKYEAVSSRPSSFSASSESFCQDFFRKHQHDLEVMPLQKWELGKAILQSRSSAAAGYDGITNEVLKLIWKSDLQGVFCSMFQIAWKSHPIEWRHAIIHPTPKGNGDFRPISLLSQLSKILEKIMASRLEKECFHNSIISPRQFGCQRGSNVQDALMLLQHYASTSNYLCVFFSDISKAYDTTNPAILVEKMIDKGFPPNMCYWVKEFLTMRSFQVRFQGELSSVRFPSFGLAQGSPLSVILWKLFFDPPHSEMDLIYMDDLAFVVQAPSRRQLAEKLQLKLNNLWNWGQDSRMAFDTEKSVCLALNHHSEVDVNFGNEDVKFVSQKKYLGFLFREQPFKVSSSSDTFDPWEQSGFDVEAQIYADKMETVRRLPWIQALSGGDVALRRLLYLSLIASKLSFGLQLKHFFLHDLQSLQWKCLRIVTGVLPSTPNQLLDSIADVPSIPFLYESQGVEVLSRMLRSPMPGTNPLREEFQQWLSDPVLHDQTPFGALNDLHHDMFAQETFFEQELSVYQEDWLELGERLDVDLSGRRSWKESDFHIFSDGSFDKDTLKGTCAAIGPFDEIVLQFEPCVNPLEAEIKAMRLAAEACLVYFISEQHVSPIECPSIAFISDSRSLIRMICSPPNFISDDFASLLDALVQLSGLCYVGLYWVKGHSGVFGNEMVDTLCSEARSMPITKLPHTASYLRLQAKRKRETRTIGNYSGCFSEVPSDSIDFRRLHSLPFNRTRLILRFLTDHHSLRGHQLRLLQKQNRAPELIHLATEYHCRFCLQTVETLPHLLWECRSSRVCMALEQELPDVRYSSECYWTQMERGGSDEPFWMPHSLTLELLCDSSQWICLTEFLFKIGIYF